MSTGQLASAFKTPTLTDRGLFLTSPDLSSTFPRLYVPMDFVKLVIDWSACDTLTSVDGYFPRMPRMVPHMAELNPSPLTTSIPLHLQQDRPPRGTQLEASTQHSNLVRALPIKYNCRVLLSLGLNEDEPGGKFCVTRRLRLLVGRRKGNICLLGGAWSQELDGGDPRVDSSCLLSTARRCVRALSYCDLDRCAVLTKLMEVTYHRPEESISGRAYPEQEERTFIYFAAIHAPNYSANEFSKEWDLFSRRSGGLEIGPRLSPANLSVEESHASIDGTERDSGVFESKTDDTIDEGSDNPQTEKEGSSQIESQQLEPPIGIDDIAESRVESVERPAQTREISTEGSETQCDSVSLEETVPTSSLGTKSLFEKPLDPKLLICPQVC